MRFLIVKIPFVINVVGPLLDKCTKMNSVALVRIAPGCSSLEMER